MNNTKAKYKIARQIKILEKNIEAFKEAKKLINDNLDYNTYIEILVSAGELREASIRIKKTLLDEVKTLKESKDEISRYTKRK